MDKWIKVSEQLPPLGVDVLTWDGSARSLGYIPENWKEILVKLCFFDFTTGDYNGDVTYWMPLPIAPYDPDFGDNKLCKCDHPYYRHFDSYEDMEPVGCKYCECQEFDKKEE